MSEFQYIGFRAVDGPLTKKQLEFMRTQSSRVEITPWSFENTYEFGDFSGDDARMLREGYDDHLQNANLGIRKLSVRLPQGSPISEREFLAFVDDGETLAWKPDAQGVAGILTIAPMVGADNPDQIWDVGSYLDRLLGVRQMLTDEELRPLYVGWLCACHYAVEDPDTLMEPPIPAGFGEADESINVMVEFYGLDPLLLGAAAENSSPRVCERDTTIAISEWLETIDATTLRQWVYQALTDDSASMRREALKLFRDSSSKGPRSLSSEGTRSFSELLERAEFLNNETQESR